MASTTNTSQKSEKEEEKKKKRYFLVIHLRAFHYLHATADAQTLHPPSLRVRSCQGNTTHLKINELCLTANVNVPGAYPKLSIRTVTHPPPVFTLFRNSNYHILMKRQYLPSYLPLFK